MQQNGRLVPQVGRAVRPIAQHPAARCRPSRPAPHQDRVLRRDRDVGVDLQRGHPGGGRIERGLQPGGVGAAPDPARLLQPAPAGGCCGFGLVQLHDVPL